jgi:hypothetical protein
MTTVSTALHNLQQRLTRLERGLKGNPAGVTRLNCRRIQRRAKVWALAMQIKNKIDALSPPNTPPQARPAAGGSIQLTRLVADLGQVISDWTAGRIELTAFTVALADIISGLESCDPNEGQLVGELAGLLTQLSAAAVGAAAANSLDGPERSDMAMDDSFNDPDLDVDDFSLDDYSEDDMGKEDEGDDNGDGPADIDLVGGDPDRRRRGKSRQRSGGRAIYKDVTPPAMYRALAKPLRR